MEPRIIRSPMSPEAFRAAMAEREGTMIKVVVDVTRRLLALGGDLHADGEQVLLDDGSRQEDVWGANVYPGKPAAQRTEYTSLINIRPRQGNRSMEIEDQARRDAVATVITDLLPMS